MVPPLQTAQVTVANDDSVVVEVCEGESAVAGESRLKCSASSVNPKSAIAAEICASLVPVMVTWLCARIRHVVVVVGDGDRRSGDGFAGIEEVEVGVGDGVGPVDEPERNIGA